MEIEQTYLDRGARIARMVPHVLAQRGLEPCFTDWLLTRTESGQTWLFGALDVRQVTRLERYIDPDLLHQVCTVCRGVPVYLSNTSGLRYGFLLSPRPRLPGRADFPGIERGIARLGVGVRGEVRETWERLGHLLVAGMTGVGKSVFLRLLVHQAITDGARLFLADLDGATFPMLRDNPALLAPIAGDPQEVHQVVALALGECDRRAALYAAMGGYPDKLDEYNGRAAKAGEETLPRVLVILDEFNATVVASGGARAQFAADVATLSWRGRKFGVNVIVAAQDFAKDIVGRMRDQLTAVLFRVQSKELARAVNCAGAWKITRPGRALSPRWGVFQAYFLDKGDLVASTPGAGILSTAELDMIVWAVKENGGYLSLADIQARAHTLARAGAGAGARVCVGETGQGYARRLADAWAARGWLEKDPLAGNKRRITDDLRQIAYKLQTLQTLQTLTSGLQTDLQTDPAQPTNLQTDLHGPVDDIVGALGADLPINWR